MRLDAHAIPEDALAAAAASLVSRFAFETDVRVLHAALQFGAAIGAALRFGVGPGIGIVVGAGISIAFSAAGIGRAGGGITGATSGGTAS